MVIYDQIKNLFQYWQIYQLLSIWIVQIERTSIRVAQFCQISPRFHQEKKLFSKRKREVDLAKGEITEYCKNFNVEKEWRESDCKRLNFISESFITRIITMQWQHWRERRLREGACDIHTVHRLIKKFEFTGSVHNATKRIIIFGLSVPHLANSAVS